MKVGDLIVNNHPSSGCTGKIGIVVEKSKTLQGSIISLINVLCEGEIMMWLESDCEVIDGSR